MNTDYVFLCGVMWTQYASEDAGRELMRALHSENPEVVSLACALLEAPPAAPRLSVQ
jgi:hypothetical protein